MYQQTLEIEYDANKSVPELTSHHDTVYAPTIAGLRSGFSPSCVLTFGVWQSL